MHLVEIVPRSKPESSPSLYNQLSAVRAAAKKLRSSMITSHSLGVDHVHTPLENNVRGHVRKPRSASPRQATEMRFNQPLSTQSVEGSRLSLVDLSKRDAAAWVTPFQSQ